MAFLRVGNRCINYAFIREVKLVSRNDPRVQLSYTDTTKESFTGDVAAAIILMFWGDDPCDSSGTDDLSPAGDEWIEHLKQRKRD